MQAIVVFHDRGAGFWPWLFGRPGFRHCFVALNDGRAWVVLDPCSHGTKVEAEIAADYDLAGFYRDCGFTVLEGRVTRQAKPYPVWFFTCVEAVKRVLGVRGWWIWTPHQLYRHLETTHGFDLQPAEAEGTTAATAAADTGRSLHRRGAAQGAGGGEAPPWPGRHHPDQRPG